METLAFPAEPVSCYAGQSNRTIFMIDGEFVKKRIMQLRSFFLDGRNLRSYCLKHLSPTDILQQLYYYDAIPFNGYGEHPMTGFVDFSHTPLVDKKNRFLKSIKNTRDFAVRLGCSSWSSGEWMLDNGKLGELAAGEINWGDIDPKDIYPNIRQKGVTVLMGIDAAAIAFKRLADKVVILGNDMELAPVAQVLKSTGIKVYLDPMWTKASDALREAVDGVSNQLPRPPRDMNGHKVHVYDDIKDVRHTTHRPSQISTSGANPAAYAPHIAPVMHRHETIVGD